MAYLCHHYEPDNTNEQIRMPQWARAYKIVDNNLYKVSISGPLVWCLNKANAQNILSEVHAGICRGHSGARSLAAKVLRQGFYWPAMIDDAAKLVSTCEAYQKISHCSKSLTQSSQLIAPSSSLQRWGIDIIVKLKPAQGNYIFTIVVLEYFTKWVKAKPVTNITSATIKKFF
jgi:hypothetical protein